MQTHSLTRTFPTSSFAYDGEEENQKKPLQPGVKQDTHARKNGTNNAEKKIDTEHNTAQRKNDTSEGKNGRRIGGLWNAALSTEAAKQPCTNFRYDSNWKNSKDVYFKEQVPKSK
jgi:hypothetical protein